MPDPIFAHPRLAAVYDAFESPRTDLAAYIAICADLNENTVADVGCGTGSLCIELASHGFSVTGVDPAASSLEVAAAKPGADSVEWINGVAADLLSDATDVAVMTGNVAQVFLTDEEWHANLAGIHRALRHRGHLVFEARRPERREWEEWALDTEPVTLTVPGQGEVEQRFKVTSVDLPLVSFRYSYRFESDGETLTSDSTLRFRDRDEIEATLRTVGFSVDEVREAPDRPGGEYVFIARRVED